MPANLKADDIQSLRQNLQYALNRGTRSISSVTTDVGDVSSKGASTEIQPRRIQAPSGGGASEYQVGPLIASGGMGAVFSVRDLNVQREVAMKVALDSNREGNRRHDRTLRFIHEAQITGQLEHPNIVPVHQLGADAEGNIFYTMKMVRGDTLQDIIERLRGQDAETIARYPVARLLTIFQKVCDAVAFAHSRGVIHRDLKPENIMIGDYGEVLVMDWGVARPLDRIASSVGDSVILSRSEVFDQRPEDGTTNAMLTQGSALRTMAGTILGTPTFMAPEQAQGDSDGVDQRADVYALGGILYNILTLEVPVLESNVNVLMVKKAKGDIIPPECFSAESPQRMKLEQERWLPLPVHCPNQRVPASLAAVAMKALAPKPANRYETVKALQQDIEAYQGGFATSAQNASLVTHAMLLVKRHRREATVAAIAALVIGIMVTLFMMKIFLDWRRMRHQQAQLRVVNENLRQQREEVLEVSRAAAPRFVFEAETFMAEGRWEDARTSTDIALTLDPNLADAHLVDARLRLGQLDLDAASAAFSRASEGPSPEVSTAARSGARLVERLRAIDPEMHDATDYAMMMANEAAEAREFTVASQIYRRVVDESLAANELEGVGRGVIRLLALVNPRQAHLRAAPPRVVEDGLELDLHDNQFITNLSPLRGLPLRGINLANALELEDLSPLQGLPLRYLDLSASKVKDVTPLAGMPLERLNLSGTNVRDLRPLSGMPLVELDLADARYVSGIEPLTGMPLQVLNLRQVPARDLTPLRGMPLKWLNLEWAPVRTLEPLAGLPLEHLILDWTRIRDIEALRGMPLIHLSLENCKDLRRLDALASLKQLKTVILPPEPGSIAPLRQCPNIEKIRVDNADLTPREFFQRYR